MTTYLTIITTVLVATQIIRLTQNAIQLKRMKDKFYKRTDDNILTMWKKLSDSVDVLSEIVQKERR